MSPIPYPQYDVRKIIEALKKPSQNLVNVFAHRGMRLLNASTENSYSSVTSGARAGCEGIEIDARLTTDKQAIVLHENEGLGRITNIRPPTGESYYNPFTGVG